MNLLRKSYRSIGRLLHLSRFILRTYCSVYIEAALFIKCHKVVADLQAKFRRLIRHPLHRQYYGER